MKVFRIKWHEEFHEYPIINLDGVTNSIDYFLPDKILIEMKSHGKSHDSAFI
ncbi:MAG: hypothetical protein AAGU03_03905 [Anaerolineaceae bacterium]